MKILIRIAWLHQLFFVTVLLPPITTPLLAQQVQPQKGSGTKTREEEVRLGSQTAKAGFQNEDEICAKLNNWKADSDARNWLEAMNYRLSEIEQLKAAKPHGEKADVEVRVKTKTGEHIEGISIKLVSNPQGFNQIDKRWLKTYVQMWDMPDEVHSALQFFVGEVPPSQSGRDARRMFLNELSESQQQAVLNFFSSHRNKIVSDLFAGEGEHSAAWIMVTLKVPEKADNATKKSSTIDKKRSGNPTSPTKHEEDKPQWVLCSIADTVAFFGEGEVQITPAGSLKIGRITMQRKGGDNGRESANMLQFKINPAELFEIRR